MKNFGKMALCGCSWLAISMPAFGQDAAPQGAETAASDESVIIVTARRKDENIQDVPLTVQAVSGDELQKLEIRQFEDLTSIVPGLQLAADPSGFGSVSTLRGVDFNARAAGSLSTVEFYRNDTVITPGALFQALYDIGQIEVLRGPQGTLRGRATPSGSITVTTRRPDMYEAGGYMSGSIAENSKWNIEGAINVPIIAGKLGARLAGFVGRNRGDQVTGLDVQTGETSDDIFDRVQAIRASVRADPFDGILILDFNYEGIDNDTQRFAQVESFSLVDSSVAASPVTIRAEDQLGLHASPIAREEIYKIYNWQAQLNLFGQSLTYVGARHDGSTNSFGPGDDANVLSNPVAPNGLLYGQTTVGTTPQRTHEIRLQSQERIAGLFDYVVGAFFDKQASPSVYNSNTAFAVPTPVGPQLVSLLYTNVQRYREQKEFSYFGNLTFYLGDRTEISGGIRRIEVKTNSGVRVDNGDPDPNNWFNNPAFQVCAGYSNVPGCDPKFKTTIYSATLKHRLNDNLMVYGAYGSSWRPTYTLIGYQGQPGDFLGQFLAPPPEESDSFEVGVKAAALDNRLRFNISAYYQKFTNFKLYVSSPVATVNGTSTADAVIVSPFSFVAPVPVKVKGVEADFSFEPSDNFSFGGAIAYSDGKIKNGTIPCLDLNDDNVPDTTLPTAADYFTHVGTNQVDICAGNFSSSSQPKWSGTLQGEYSRELGSDIHGYVRGLLTWKGKSTGNGLNPYDSVKAFALLDLFAGVRSPDRSWEITGFVKNAFNTHRVLTRNDSPQTTGFRQHPFIPGSLGPVNYTNYLRITTNMPREFGISARIAIGSR